MAKSKTKQVRARRTRASSPAGPQGSDAVAAVEGESLDELGEASAPGLDEDSGEPTDASAPEDEPSLPPLDPSAPRGVSGLRNLSARSARKGGDGLELSRTGKPSRKSTRKSKGRVKRTTNLQLRAQRRTCSPSARAERAERG